MSATIIELTVDVSDRIAVEAKVNEDIELFDQWFQGKIKDGPLSKPEIAILKTYLYFKIYGEEGRPTNAT